MTFLCYLSAYNMQLLYKSSNQKIIVEGIISLTLKFIKKTISTQNSGSEKDQIKAFYKYIKSTQR